MESASDLLESPALPGAGVKGVGALPSPSLNRSAFIDIGWVFALGCLCALIASLLAGVTIFLHLAHYAFPSLQKYVVRILLFVPVYALSSLVILIFPGQFLYVEALRDVWEAVVVYSFFCLILARCGGEDVCASALSRDPGSIRHPQPIPFLLHLWRRLIKYSSDDFSSPSSSSTRDANFNAPPASSSSSSSSRTLTAYPPQYSSSSLENYNSDLLKEGRGGGVSPEEMHAMSQSTLPPLSSPSSFNGKGKKDRFFSCKTSHLHPGKIPVVIIGKERAGGAGGGKDGEEQGRSGVRRHEAEKEEEEANMEGCLDLHRGEKRECDKSDDCPPPRSTHQGDGAVEGSGVLVITPPENARGEAEGDRRSRLAMNGRRGHDMTGTTPRGGGGHAFSYHGRSLPSDSQRPHLHHPTGRREGKSFLCCGGRTRKALGCIGEGEESFLVCDDNIPTGLAFVKGCKRWILQFIFVKPTMAILSVVMFSVGKYHSLEYQIPYMVLYNFSICGALYALGLFYLATRKLPALRHFHPVGKFFAMKLVIVATWYQAFFLGIVDGMTVRDVTKWSNWLLCVEMPFFALLNTYAYPVVEFLPLPHPSSTSAQAGAAAASSAAPGFELDGSFSHASTKEFSARPIGEGMHALPGSHHIGGGYPSSFLKPANRQDSSSVVIVSQGIPLGDVPQGGMKPAACAASSSPPLPVVSSTTLMKTKTHPYSNGGESQEGGKSKERRGFSPSSSLTSRGHGVVAEVGGAVAAAASKIDATLHVAATTIGRPFQGISCVTDPAAREQAFRNARDAVFMSDVVSDAYYNFHAKYNQHALLINQQQTDTLSPRDTSNLGTPFDSPRHSPAPPPPPSMPSPLHSTSSSSSHPFPMNGGAAGPSTKEVQISESPTHRHSLPLSLSSSTSYLSSSSGSGDGSSSYLDDRTHLQPNGPHFPSSSQVVGGGAGGVASPRRSSTCSGNGGSAIEAAFPSCSPPPLQILSPPPYVLSSLHSRDLSSSFAPASQSSLPQSASEGSSVIGKESSPSHLLLEGDEELLSRLSSAPATCSHPTPRRQMNGKSRTSSSSLSSIPGGRVGGSSTWQQAHPQKQKEESYDDSSLSASQEGGEKNKKKIMREGDQEERFFFSREEGEEECREDRDYESSPHYDTPSGTFQSSRSVSSPTLNGQRDLENEKTNGDFHDSERRRRRSSSIARDSVKHLEEEEYLSDQQEGGAGRGPSPRQRRREAQHQAAVPPSISELENEEEEEEGDRIGGVLPGEVVGSSTPNVKTTLQLRERKKEREERSKVEQEEKKGREIKEKEKEDPSHSSVSIGEERESSMRGVDEEDGSACIRGVDDEVRSIQSEQESLSSSCSKAASFSPSSHGCSFLRENSCSSSHRPSSLSSSERIVGAVTDEPKAARPLRDTNDVNRAGELDEEKVAMKGGEEEDDLGRSSQQREGYYKDDIDGIERHHIEISIESDEEKKARRCSIFSTPSSSTLSTSSSTYPACRYDDLHTVSDASSLFSLSKPRKLENSFFSI
ncbi:transmembrane [Cystoisospora suis]|uniref:Transmembrane n=1 Tax=Cystoisospora suis TaxID=483139 RepID=A0A2C6L032_9APIC|nr:transmembrane [Cystoisospora suis]